MSIVNGPNPASWIRPWWHDELLASFVPVPMLSEETVLRIKRMEPFKKQGLTIHYCEDCNYQARKRDHVMRHAKTHSSAKDEVYYLCEHEDCPFKTSRKRELTKHGKIHKERDYKTVKKSNLTKHVSTHAKDSPRTPSDEIIDRSVQAPPTTSTTSTTSTSAYLACEYCTFATLRKSAMTHHNNTCKNLY